MIHGNNKQEVHRQSINAECEELKQATRHFVRSMFRTGVRLAFLPVNRLSPEPQQHFQTAGREFTRGLASLVHGLADGLQEMTTDANTSTTFGEGPQRDGELE